MRDTANITRQEIAEALGITPNQVEYAEASAMRKLREGLKAHGINAEDFYLLAYVLDELVSEWLDDGMPPGRGRGD